MKLTDAQLLMLDRLASGWTLCLLTGRKAHYFWFEAEPEERRPSPTTAHALWKAGLITDSKRDATGVVYAITPAGREALRAARRGGK